MAPLYSHKFHEVHNILYIIYRCNLYTVVCISLCFLSIQFLRKKVHKDIEQLLSNEPALPLATDEKELCVHVLTLALNFQYERHSSNWLITQLDGTSGTLTDILPCIKQLQHLVMVGISQHLFDGNHYTIQ